ncbi:PTS galactitol transporter subunit IIC [Affinirhizobium pseudoryzae]|uniref:PTS galactitol transporter subunit IIC n=1 Tax=Allorhizobium pseudoryzae TaxID=379684 RepID=UPI0013EDD5CC|nr:PTS transporter subunit IIC [Allorhizobium pseudoryzae]
MDAVLSGLKAIIDDLGATVLLPIMIFVIGLVLGAKPGKAFRAGVTIGVAFIGINLVIGLMWTNLSDVAQAIATNTGVKRDVVDVGWPSSAAIAFGSQVGLWVIPIGIAVNVALLLAGWTRTLNVDVWNFWHFAFVGSLVTAATGSLPYGLVAAALMAALSLFFADWSAKPVQAFYGLPGVSVPHLLSAQILPIAILTNWMIERIPGLRDIDLSTDHIQKRLGVAGEPVILGLIIGLVLGLVGFWNPADIPGMTAKVLKAGINLAAVMLLLPRMVKILMEGLIPVSEAAREFVQKRAGDRQINIGLDSAILIGHPAAISSALLLVPIAIVLSIILPGNRVILFADLAVIPFVVALAAPIVRGNVLRMVIIGTITLTIGFYIAGALAPLFTSAAGSAGFTMPANASQITAIGDGFVWIGFVVVELFSGLGWLAAPIIAVVIGLCMWLLKVRAGAMEALASASPEKTTQSTTSRVSA